MAKRRGIEALMQVVAAQWCLGSRFGSDGEYIEMTRSFPKTGSASADDFVRWAFEASGIPLEDPTPRWQRARAEIRAAFIAHLGAETVDAAALRWTKVDVLGRPSLPLPDPEAFVRNLTDEELEEELKTREDWRDRIIAQQELDRRRDPPVPVRLAVYAVPLMLLLYWIWR